MNKIIVSNKGIYINDIKVKSKIIELSDYEYLLEYIDSGCFEITFMINNNVKLVECSFDNKLEINNKYIIKNGYLDVTKFYNNDSVNEVINIDLCMDGSRINYHFANICKGIENYEININHNYKETISNVVNRSVALLNSKIKFIINSNVKSDSVKSVLDQSTRIVTMGDCDALISPNMFIDLDDVEAKHGSIIGTFKEDDIFYLMSKGISYNDTLKLLIKGYIFANLNVDIDLRMRILNIINTYWR